MCRAPSASPSASIASGDAARDGPPVTDLLLGIDCGSTVTKAALFDLDGRELAGSSSGTETISLPTAASNVGGRHLGQRRPRGPDRHGGERGQPDSGRGDRLLRARQRPLCARRTRRGACPSAYQSLDTRAERDRPRVGPSRDTLEYALRGRLAAGMAGAAPRAARVAAPPRPGHIRRDRHDPALQGLRQLQADRSGGLGLLGHERGRAARERRDGLQRPALRQARVRGARRQAARAGREHGRDRDAERCRCGRARPHRGDPGGGRPLRRGCERHRVGRCGGRVHQRGGRHLEHRHRS